jgi:hypothetical protein
LIVDGSLNATRRDSLTDPAPLVPGEVYELEIPMWPTGWVLKPGHRLRVAVSSSDFPNLWPTPEPARNRVYRGERYPSRVVLPVVPESKLPPPQLIPFDDSARTVRPGAMQVVHDQIAGTVTVTQGSYRCTASSRDPAQASIVGTHRLSLNVENDAYEITAESSIRATRTSFHVIVNLNVTKNGQLFFHKQWLSTEPRRLL